MTQKLNIDDVARRMSIHAKSLPMDRHEDFNTLTRVSDVLQTVGQPWCPATVADISPADQQVVLDFLNERY